MDAKTEVTETRIDLDALADVLGPIYGAQTGDQVHRYRNALDSFWTRFGHGPALLFRAPGRINLIGEHTDYNRGYVMPAALDRDILLIVRPRADRIVTLENTELDFRPDSFEISMDIPHSKHARWTNYVRGAAQMIARLSPSSTVGMDCLVVGQAPYGVPRGSGLSSSSALTVAAAIALAHCAGLQVDREAFVSLCSDAEWYVGTRGGIMDQFISLLAQRDHALFLDCRPDHNGHFTTQHVPLPDGYAILIADTGVRHDNTRGEYNLRVASCRTGVGFVKYTWPEVRHLRDLENIEWGLIESLLPTSCTVADAEARGFLDGNIPGLNSVDRMNVRACCRHVWHENHRVLAACDAFSRGDMLQAGSLISLAHRSARDDYDISCPEIETFVSAAAEIAGVAGSRIIGAGWGGCALVVVRNECVAGLQDALEQQFAKKHGYVPAVFPCRFGAAAGYAATVVDKRS